MHWMLPVAALLCLSACGPRTDSGDDASDLGHRRRGAPDAGGTSGGAGSAFRQRLDELVLPNVDAAGVKGKSVGLLVGVFSPKEGRLFAGYGATTVGGTTPPEADSLFEIGSVTKVYTGLALALAVKRGALRLDETIDRFFPDGAPDYQGKAIQLVDLATHTSGLPTMPTNLPKTEPGNPGAGYTEADFRAFMASYALPTEPGAQYVYSNTGAGTVGYILGKVTGAPSFEALVAGSIGQKLDLRDTRVELTAAQESRRLQGYRDGKPAPKNAIGAPLQGGGALRSTGTELLAWVESALKPPDAELAEAWALTLTPQRASPMGQSGLFLDLAESDGRTVYSKSGGTAGFSTYIAFTTSPQAAVVLLSNTNGVHLRELALAVLAELPQ